MSGPTFLSETRERFLKAILAQLPVDRVRELYLFQPMKQGGVESGVAVVAGYSEEAVAEAAARAAESAAAEEHVADVAPVADSQESVAEQESVVEQEFVADAAQPAADAEERVAGGDSADVGAVQPVDEPPTVDLEEVTGEAAEALACGVPADAADGAAVAEQATAADGEDAAAEQATAADEAAASDEPPPTAEEPAGAPAPAAPAEKYTVYTARYRHVLKGPDRGKWEASLVAEAEAPLLSIETVVRGVQRRSGDVDAPDHMTAADIRAALRLTNPSTSDAA